MRPHRSAKNLQWQQPRRSPHSSQPLRINSISSTRWLVSCIIAALFVLLPKTTSGSINGDSSLQQSAYESGYNGTTISHSINGKDYYFYFLYALIVSVPKYTSTTYYTYLFGLVLQFNKKSPRKNLKIFEGRTRSIKEEFRPRNHLIQK